MSEKAAAIVSELLTPGGRADPYRHYAELHALGPLARLSADSLVVCGYDAVNEVLRNPGFGLLDQPPAGDGVPTALASMRKSILRANPPEHGRMRSLMSRVFTPRRIAGLEPAIVRATDALLDDLLSTTAAAGSVDFMDRLAFPLPVTVICELLGVPPADRAAFRPLASDLTDALELTFGDSVSDAATRAAEELADYFDPLVEAKRRRPDDGLVSALVAVRDAEDGRLSDEELVANLITLLVAGFETTTGLLGNGMSVLLDRPEIAAALRDGGPAVAGFVEEVLRHDSPVQLTTRIARGDGLTAAGRPVPEGTGVVVLIGAANRDPGRYDDPDSFDPTRSDIRPLRFGAGAHVCLGNRLARLESRVAFERLLERFGRLDRPPGLESTRRDRLVLRGYETLPVVVA